MCVSQGDGKLVAVFGTSEELFEAVCILADVVKQITGDSVGNSSSGWVFSRRALLDVFGLALAC